MARKQGAKLAIELFEKVQNRYNLMARTKAREQLNTFVVTISDEIEKINSLCREKKTRILHETIDKVQAYNIKLVNLSDELNNPFLLFIVGDGKFGKSTLINALIGCEAAEAGQLPRTWKIDVFYGGVGKQAEVRYRDGKKELKSFEETKRILAEEERKFDESEDLIETELAQYQEHLKTVQAKREKKDELRKYKLYRSGITEVHWPVPINPILRSFRLVDTPGINQKLSIGSVEASAAEYYSKADGIIWLLAADKIAAKDTRENIDEIIARFGHRTDNVIAVINKIDRVEKDGGRQAVDKVIADAYRFYGDVFKEIIPISATQGLAAVLKNDVASIERSGLSQLHVAIERQFLTKAQQIQISSKSVGASSILDDIRMETLEYLKRMNDDSDRRIQLEQAWRQDKEKIEKLADNLFASCFKEQVERVKRNAGAYQEQLWDMQDSERQRFLQDKVFEHKVFEAEIDKILKQISQNVKKAKDIHTRESAFFEYPHLQKEQTLISLKPGTKLGSITISNQTFDVEDGNVVVGGAAAIGAAALLGPVGLLAYFLVETDFGKSFVKFITKQFVNLPAKIVNQYENKLKEVKINLKKSVIKILEDAGQNVSNMREVTYADLHGLSEHTDKIRQALCNIIAVTEFEITPLKVRDIIFNNKTATAIATEPVRKGVAL